MSVSTRLRLLGLLCLLGGILQLSDTPLDLWWSAPTSPVHALARLIWAIANLALIGGPIGIIARRFASPGWLTVAGAGIAIVGMLSQVSGMISYLVFPNFGAGRVLTPPGGILIALGMVILGIAALLRKTLSGWQVWTPLLVGLYFIVQLTFIQVPFFLSKGQLIFAPLVDLWGLFWILLGVVIVWSKSVAYQQERKLCLMAKPFRPTLFFRVGHIINTLLLRAGVKKGNMTLLTVRGRKSGQPHTIPVALVEYDGQRWLTAPYGVVNWVRNLRVAGEATLTCGRHTEHISVCEMTAQEAAPILKRSLIGARSFVLAYFDVTPDSSLAEFEHEASRHPVFLVRSLS